MNTNELYNTWKKAVADNSELSADLDGINDEEIFDRFYRELDFGTAGLRGVLGAGTNRMNIYTVRKATQGLCEEIKKLGKDAMDAGVVIAYDCRHKSDVFAMESAKVIAANGIKAYVFDELRPTPELSFAVRYLKTTRGIVITASHNPKEYNGYKAYGDDGCQLPPESSDYVTAIIDKLDLRNPIYRKTSNYGHLGREDQGFSWEKTDKVEELKAILG